MPFQSEAQRRYLWANEPEIARDWTDTYGSRIQKNDGGIMRLGFYMGGASPDEGHENDPGHGANAPSDDHSYKTHHPNIHAGMKTQIITPSGDVFAGDDPTLSEKQDYFTQAWSGQPNFLGFGGGYRNLKTPGDSSRYQSRLNPMGVMSLLGGFMKKPFSLAATGFNSLRDTLGTGINAVRNKFGPAWNDWTDADNLEEFLRRRRTGETITNPYSTGDYKNAGITSIDNSMYGGDQDIFGIENARGLFRPDQMPTDFNIKYGPEGITYYEDELPEEDVITGTNYPGEDIRTETILDKAKEFNEQRDSILAKIRRANRAREKLNPPWPRM